MWSFTKLHIQNKKQRTMKAIDLLRELQSCSIVKGNVYADFKVPYFRKSIK